MKTTKAIAKKHGFINGSIDLVEVKFVPNTNYSRTTHDNMDYYIGANGKVKTKFFGK